MNKKQTANTKMQKNRIVHHLKMAAVPHKNNQYRPHLIRRTGIVLVGIIVCALQIVQLLAATGAILGEQTSLDRKLLLTDTNSERIKSGLPPLVINDALSKAAVLKVNDMFEKQYWAHTSPDGRSPWYWLSQVGYNYASAGENLAKNFKTADRVVAAWMSSPEHKANVLGAQYSQVGFAVMNGILNGKSTIIVVALYGAPATPSVVGIQDAAPKESVSVGGVSPVAHLGIVLKSLSPITIGSLGLIFLIMIIAMAAHMYRKRLPKNLQKTWYRHHGLIKAGGMSIFGIIVVFLYAGGQI